MAMGVEVRKAAADLEAAHSLAEVLRAACVAADAAESAATALARASIVDGPGYLIAADAFAVVRVELHGFAEESPGGFPVASDIGIPSHEELTELGSRLRDRLRDVRSVATDEVAAAIENASMAAHGAVRALSGSVPDDVDIR
jgi:hypothetical protein